MRRWGPGFDWDHLQNGVILLVVVAANSPTQTTSRPPELPPSQSAAVASNDTPAPRNVLRLRRRRSRIRQQFVRVRVGDTVDVHLKNSADSNMIHSAAPARARFRTADKIALRDNTDQFPRLVDRSPLSGSPA